MTISTEAKPGVSREPGLFLNLNCHNLQNFLQNLHFAFAFTFFSTPLVPKYSRFNVLLVPLIPLSAGYMVLHVAGGGWRRNPVEEDLNIPFHFWLPLCIMGKLKYSCFSDSLGRRTFFYNNF